MNLSAVNVYYFTESFIQKSDTNPDNFQATIKRQIFNRILINMPFDARSHFSSENTSQEGNDI